MEENTVLLGLQDYNKLKEFKDNVKRGEFVQIDCWNNRIYYYEKDEIVQKLNDSVARLKEEVVELKEKLNPTSKEPSVSNLKEMNLLQLLKWWGKTK